MGVAWVGWVNEMEHWAWMHFGYWDGGKASRSFAGELARGLEAGDSGVARGRTGAGVRVLATRVHGQGYAAEAVRGDCVGHANIGTAQPTLRGRFASLILSTSGRFVGRTNAI